MKTQLYGSYITKYYTTLLNLPLRCWGTLYYPSALTRADFKYNRFHGDEKKDTCAQWIERDSYETSITWVKGEKRSDGFVYGKLESNGLYHYECRYDADPDDLEWMRKTNCNYLKRILQEGQLKALEPDVYYLCLISAPRNVDNAIAKDFDIGTWWSTQVDKPNIADLL